MGISEKRLQELFSTMSEELYHAGEHKSNESQVFAIRRQAERLKKRARLGSSGLRGQALENFQAVNDRVGRLVLKLDPFIEHNARLFIFEAFERYNRRRDPELIQIPYDPRPMFERWKYGPGASNGVRGTHTAEKIWQPMTCTAPARTLVQMLRLTNTYFMTYDIGQKRMGINVISGSRMTTVPKNEETERTIAIEPSGNMALQLGLGEYIADVLRSIGLDIRDQQPKNKLLALRGSVTGGLATIDMTSASDMFSPKLVRRLLPPGLYDTMLRIRSPETVLPDKRETIVQLNMMSTMGNGFTFPMMTLIFVALIYAVRLRRGGPSKYIDWTDTGVFGDDLIVPTSECADLIEVLEGCGFIVNHGKTYLSGPFRESCGGDYHLGRDVTPVYVKQLATNPHIYVALNGVFEWCAKQDVLLPRTISLLASYVKGRVNFVPEWHGNDAGFRVTQVEARYKYHAPAPEQVVTKCHHFEVMLACGGYIVPRYPDIATFVFTPRPLYKTRYVVRKSRLPKGYLDGRDPLSRADRISTYIESYAFLVRHFGN